MDSGVVAEFDTVPTLMANAKSSFRAMVVEAGLDEGFAALKPSELSRGASGRVILHIVQLAAVFKKFLVS